MHTVDYYLSKGFDRPMAEYFAAGRKKIVSASPRADYTLLLRFDNGESRLYDCKPVIQPGTVFAPLLDADAFRRVYLDDSHCVSWDIDPNVDSKIVWSNKLDLDADACYVDSIPVGGDLHV